MRTGRILLLVAITQLFTFCSEEEKVPEPYRPTDAFDAYMSGLETTRISETAMGREWVSASKEALKEPMEIPVPYAETFHINSNRPDAMGFKFSAKRGQAIEVLINSDFLDSTFLFVDLYRIEIDSLDLVRHVASADSVQRELKFEPRKDASYVLRIIPEILRGGQFSVEIKNTPTLAFPVSGKNKRAIQSLFGAPRDGGRREHHGVDIFAKRHTPIIAPVRAQVRSVDVKKLGGNVIWLRDTKRSTSLYFAHLQTQLVEEGQWVNPGDTIGTVGNTGNARTTPPHLHFGIYSRGPVNPYDFIVPADTVPDEITAPSDLLGQWARVTQKVSLRSAYGSKFEALEDLELAEELWVEGAAGRFFRVSKKDGSRGYVLASTLSGFATGD